MNRKPLLLAAVTLTSIIYLAGLVHYAQVRPIDGDEGYYSTAARLVWEGKTPYRDFSYPQAPLLPYIYSWIWAVRPRSLVSMRFLSAACGGIAVFLWGVCLVSVKKLPTKVALATFAAVLLNPYWVSWHVVVKTFAVANLLMSIAAICLYAALHSDRARWYFMGGLALGACASARLLYGPLIPVVLVWLLHREWRMSKPPFPKSLAFLAGATSGLLPMILSFAGDAQAFIFNNIQYHSLLASHESFRHTLRVYSIVILLLARHSYLSAEVLLAAVGGLSLLKLYKKCDALYTDQDYLYFKLVFLMLLVYIATALIPFPPFDQYFDSPLVPFLVPLVAEGLRATFRFGRKWVVLLAVVAPILLFREIGRDAAEYSRHPHLQLSSYRKVTQAVEANSRSDDMVLSFWPGYVFESGRRYLPGSEDHFAYAVTTKISPEERARYHIISKDEIITAVSKGTVKLVISFESPWIYNMSQNELQQFHRRVEANYSLVGTIDDVRIYRKQ